MVTRAYKRSAIEQARLEHDLLDAKLKYLNSQLEKRQVPLEEIVKLLDGLRRFFVLHFQKEECAGLFDVVTERAPHLTRIVSRLTQEHYELLARIDNLVRFARRGTGQPLCWHMLSLRLRDFIKKLHEHESEENGLLQMAYCDDLGTKD
jgi:iron-sulfur cluster repair protein YtfE (RIC family)